MTQKWTPKWNLVVMSKGIMSKKVLDTNSCLHYLENKIDQDVKIISIQEEDDNVDGILDNIDGDKYGYDDRGEESDDVFDDFCNNDESVGRTDLYSAIFSDEEDNYNSILSSRKPLLSHRVSKKPKTSWTNPKSYLKSDATIEKLSDLILGIRNKNALNLHVNPSEPLGKYQCFLCPLNFAKKNYLLKHLMKHLDRSRPFMCPVCEKTFPKSNRLKLHINGSADIRPYQCEQCDEAFTTSSALSRHKRNRHSGRSPYKCDKCDYKTFEKKNLNIHLATHTDERPFKCNYCSYASKSQRYLTSHERIHKNDKRYKCDICYSRFIQPQSLRDHRKTHFNKDLIVHRCRFCPTELGSAHALRKHVEIVHKEF